MALFCASGGSHTYLDIPHWYQRRIKWPLERRLQPSVTFPLWTRFICQAEWAFCTQSFTWYKTTMLESKRHAGTSQTIKWCGLFVCPVLVFLRACLHEGRRPQIGEVTCGGSPHLSCKRDQIKMRDYMDRRVTPSKRVTSHTWGPPPPCKQALSLQHGSFIPREWLATNGLLVLLITY